MADVTDELVNLMLTEYKWPRHQVEIGIRAKFRCEYCGKDLLASWDDLSQWQADHIVPRSKGGELNMDNLALSCRGC